MTNTIQPAHLTAIALAGWLNRLQKAVIDYFIEENCFLKEKLEGQRLRFTDEQRVRLAVKIQGALANLGHIIAPNTVKNILKRHGIEPAPECENHTSWNVFLKVPVPFIAAPGVTGW